MCTRISEPLLASRLPNGKRRLERDLVYLVEGHKIVVPKGFATDYSSIPQAFSWLVDWRRVDMAGVVHDWLYQSGSVTRKYADKVWRKIAQVGDHHANFFQSTIGWIGLRLGGWLPWSKYRNNE